MVRPPSRRDDARWPRLDRLTERMTPTSPADWRRFVLLAVTWVVSILVVNRILSWIGGADVNPADSGFLLIGGYGWVAGSWWRAYFTEAAQPSGRRVTDDTLRRWLVRGRAVWFILAYVVVVGQASLYSDDGGDEAGNESWLNLLLFLSLPLGLAYIVTLGGRYFAGGPARQD